MLKVLAAAEVQLLLCALVAFLLLLAIPETKKGDLNWPNELSFQISVVLIGSK